MSWGEEVEQKVIQAFASVAHFLDATLLFVLATFRGHLEGPEIKENYVNYHE